jgi:hypothetical protein
VTVGSVVDEPAVCDMAVPSRVHSNTVDRIATAEGAIRLDNTLMTYFPNPDISAVPVRTPAYRTRRSEKYHWKYPMYLANFPV